MAGPRFNVQHESRPELPGSSVSKTLSSSTAIHSFSVQIFLAATALVILLPFAISIWSAKQEANTHALIFLPASGMMFMASAQT